jgi:GT2 family glycosyltransferase
MMAATHEDATDREAGLVTVCFPTTGRLTYIERAFSDLTGQTYDPVEILILDNASAEPAPATLQRFAERTPRTRVLRVDERVPMFENFNRGIAAARGEFIAFFHDDDEYDADFLSRMIALLRQYPDAAFAGGNYDVIDEHGAISRRNRLIGRTELWPAERFIGAILRRGRSPMSTPGLVFRASALAEEGFDARLPMNWGDFTMLMRLSERGGVAVDAAPLYRWRVHGANASNVAFSESIPMRTRVLDAYVDEYAARHPRDTGRVTSYRRLVRRTRTKGLLWGWLAAGSPEDAARCRALLTGSSGARLIALVLRMAEMLGVSLEVRHRVVPAIRRVAARLVAFGHLRAPGASAPAGDAAAPSRR